ncbi:Hydroxyacylglutathione hydrolase [Phocoenobacter uteri]|uniref:Hydroxyacylglutathione hydrolase n=1 Tax=Phocoenobacter uteri TaxID=146806 RepID=A0A379C9B5_9PAST|nr:hydroxyacylglutathione hydrolase [Phocoenobacter uteri]MDG6882734.1 hydroxyacylglutathione hydrolase [Phocoenobacter uteri]SUB58900.1 Hydroxyacylglutathione hydrolase [Phocoenobacter uteri]
MQIIPIKALSDNYIWLIQKKDQVIVVDPSQADELLDFFAKNDLNPTAILLTYNHADHVGGVVKLVEHYPNLPIYGSKEVSQFANHIMVDQQEFECLGSQTKVIKTAGHTAEHISYLIDNKHLFCGDSLFSAGCGRVFTGDYNAQFDTLQRLGQLADDVKIYPAHEYTQSNLEFVKVVMPNNQAVQYYTQQVAELRCQDKITLPSTMGLEKQVNPFLMAKSLAEFIELRKKKDCF